MPVQRQVEESQQNLVSLSGYFKKPQQFPLHHTGLSAWSLYSLFKGSAGWQHEGVRVPQDSPGN